MIRQHFLQQQRLNNNRDRLLQRYQHIHSPHISEFRTFGRSSLPGRNYDQHINTMSGDGHHRRDSLVAQSRAGVGSSSETYRFMGDGASEILPRDISSIMQHTREQPRSLVHAEKFEPVSFYEHPVFGRTPAYVRPVFNGRQHREVINDNGNDSDTEEDDEVRSHTSRDNSSRVVDIDERKSLSPVRKNNDEGNESDHAPLGYMSYKNWKAKYEDLIPVNPLLYNIYTQRPNGSINSYGQSVHSSSGYHRALTHDHDDAPTPTLSDIGSVTSDTRFEMSAPTNRQYHRLKPQLFPRTVPSPLREPMGGESDGELTDDEASPPDSPVPYLSRNRTNPITSTSITTPSTPFPRITPSTINTTGTSPSPLIPTNTSNIPPAPPMPPSLLSVSSNHTYQAPSTLSSSFPPPAPLMPSALLPTSSTNTYQVPSTLPTSLPPLAPPMPPSLLSTASNNRYQAPSTLSTSFPPPAPPMPPSLLPTSSTNTYQAPSTFPTSMPPRAPPMPPSLLPTTSNNTYSTPSNASIPGPSNSSIYVPTTKAVTFGGSSSFPTANNDISSSSDSDDDAKQKRQRRRKRQAAAGVTVDSSSDD